MFRLLFVRSFQSSASSATMYSNRTTEARNAVRLAQKMREDKAIKCFNYAISICPKDSYILNEYGLFLEKKGEIFYANTLFCKAHMLDSKSEEAAQNKKRTQSLVRKILKNMLQKLDEKESRLAANRTRKCIVEAERVAFQQFCYHTISLEGIKTDHETTVQMWQAYEFAEKNLGTKGLSRDLLLGIHRRILGSLHPEAGKFRSIDILVNGYPTTDIRILDSSVNGFLISCNACLNCDGHPIEMAANIHQKLVTLHPFVDGNGRVARMLLVTVLRKRGYPFVTIPEEEIEEYYEAIRQGQ